MNTFPAWITKYALTTGIVQIEAETTHTSVMIGDRNRTNACYFHEGREWHRFFEAAKVRAEEMRVAKIASLRKSIAKLEKVSFT